MIIEDMIGRTSEVKMDIWWQGQNGVFLELTWTKGWMYCRTWSMLLIAKQRDFDTRNFPLLFWITKKVKTSVQQSLSREPDLALKGIIKYHNDSKYIIYHPNHKQIQETDLFPTDSFDHLVCIEDGCLAHVLLKIYIICNNITIMSHCVTMCHSVSIFNCGEQTKEQKKFGRNETDGKAKKANWEKVVENKSIYMYYIWYQV